jgi:Uma2 family endonuclease
LAEVLSVSNQDYDRGFKAKHCRRLPSLRELLLIDQTRAAIERYVRSPDGS